MKRNILTRMIKDESGATAIEYGLIVAFIAVAVIGAFASLSTKIGTFFTEIEGKLAVPTK